MKRTSSLIYPTGIPPRKKARKSFRSKSLAAKVNRILAEQEKKFFDTNSTISWAAGTTGTVLPLNPIVAGSAGNNRDGRRVTMISSMAKYSIQGPGAGSVVPEFRLLVVYDKQANGNTPVLADFFEDPTTPKSPLQMAFKDRFVVIHDNYSGTKSPYGITAASSNQPFYWQYYRKCDLTAEFGGLGTVPTTGALWLVALGPNAATTLGNIYHRLRFTDN